MSDWLKQVGPNVAGYATVAAIGIGGLVLFRVARRIVQLGYFLLYFFIGFGVVFAASAYATKSLQVPLSMPIVGGLAFAGVASAMRAKLMRVVSAVMLVGLFSLAGKFWAQYADSRKSAPAGNDQLAMHALAAAKQDFDAIARNLPRKNGEIQAGFISPEQLRKAGIEVPQKVEQKPAWHTWLTGLYDQEVEDLGLWTSGGTLEEAKKGLRLKQEDPARSDDDGMNP
jgi:hypothetical protein